MKCYYCIICGEQQSLSGVWVMCCDAPLLEIRDLEEEE